MVEDGGGLSWKALLCGVDRVYMWMGHSLRGSSTLLSALSLFFVLSCFPKYLSALNVALHGGVGDLKLGLFLILALFLMKVVKTDNGGNDSKCSCLYFIPCVIHFSSRPNGSLSTMGWIALAVSRYN